MRIVDPQPTPERARATVVAHLSRVRHDLGKYVAMQVRGLGDPAAASDAALRQALTDDLLGTRRGPAGVSDACAIWAELRPELVGERAVDGGAVDLRGDADFDALDGAMRAIGEVIAAMRAGEPARDQLVGGAVAAKAASDAARRLHARFAAGQGSGRG